MAESEIEVVDEGGARFLRLNRPPSNALSRALLLALKSSVEAAGKDDRVRAVVLSSGIPKYFSSGLDLGDMPERDARAQLEFFGLLVSAHRAVADCPKPTIAALSGAALLGGYVLALACDFRLASVERGRVSLSEARAGISPTTPILRQVDRLCAAPGLIKDMILKAKTLSAAEALSAGLVDRAIPLDGFAPEVLKEAKALAQSAPRAYAAIKRARRASIFNGDEIAAWDAGRRELEELLSGSEAQEGLAALREKRRPRWL